MISRGWIRDLLVVIEAPPGTLGRPFSVGFSLWTSYIFAIYHLFKCPNNISATLSLVTFVQAYSFNNVESDSCFMEFKFHQAFLPGSTFININILSSNPSHPRIYPTNGHSETFNRDLEIENPTSIFQHWND